MARLHGAVRDLMGDQSGWDLIWKRTGISRITVSSAKLVVLDPRVDDWLQSVDDAVEHLHRLQRQHLQLVRDDE